MVTNWPRLTGHLVPVLAYPSVREAVAWLSEAFGVAPDGGAVVEKGTATSSRRRRAPSHKWSRSR